MRTVWYGAHKLAAPMTTPILARCGFAPLGTYVVIVPSLGLFHGHDTALRLDTFRVLYEYA